MARYALRYFFDPGSGICLWAGNQAARDAFGYPVEARQLALPRGTRERMEELTRWVDRSIDWEYPAGPSLWTPGERDRFLRAAWHLLAVLREQLGSDFEIRDEVIATTPP